MSEFSGFSSMKDIPPPQSNHPLPVWSDGKSSDEIVTGYFVSAEKSVNQLGGTGHLEKSRWSGKSIQSDELGRLGSTVLADKPVHTGNSRWSGETVQSASSRHRVSSRQSSVSVHSGKSRQADKSGQSVPLRQSKIANQDDSHSRSKSKISRCSSPAKSCLSHRSRGRRHLRSRSCKSRSHSRRCWRASSSWSDFFRTSLRSRSRSRSRRLIDRRHSHKRSKWSRSHQRLRPSDSWHSHRSRRHSRSHSHRHHRSRSSSAKRHRRHRSSYPSPDNVSVHRNGTNKNKKRHAEPPIVPPGNSDSNSSSVKSQVTFRVFDNEFEGESEQSTPNTKNTNQATVKPKAPVVSHSHIIPPEDQDDELKGDEKISYAEIIREVIKILPLNICPRKKKVLLNLCQALKVREDIALPQSPLVLPTVNYIQSEVKHPKTGWMAPPKVENFLAPSKYMYYKTCGETLSTLLYQN